MTGARLLGRGGSDENNRGRYRVPDGAGAGSRGASHSAVGDCAFRAEILVSAYQRLWRARIKQIEMPGQPTLYEVQTMRHANQRGWGLAGVFTTPTEAKDVLTQLIGEHMAAGSEKVIEEWHA